MCERRRGELKLKFYDYSKWLIEAKKKREKEEKDQ